MRHVQQEVLRELKALIDAGDKEGLRTKFPDIAAALEQWEAEGNDE